MVKIYSGSEIMAQAAIARLEEAGIGTVVKNNIQGGTVAGFGTLGQAVQVFVEESDEAAAIDILSGL